MRARSIKPGFFKNEELSDLGDAAMLIFAGLPGLADRLGRLEDRPRRIEAELSPFKKRNVSRILDKLDAAGFIHRYIIDGQQYIQIVNFLRHQNPHKKEPESIIPPSIIVGTQKPGNFPGDTGSSPVISGASPADSGLPIPDSPFPIPHSGLRTAGTSEPGQGPTRLSPDALALLWNETIRPPLVKCRTITPERRDRSSARLIEHPDVGYWRIVIERILASSFCRGQNDRGWIATFDWLIDPGNHVKVAEGNYDDRATRASPPSKAEERNRKNLKAAESFAAGKPAGIEVTT